jgi:hypothetical protein
MANVIKHLNIFPLGEVNLWLTMLAGFNSDQSPIPGLLHCNDSPGAKHGMVKCAHFNEVACTIQQCRHMRKSGEAKKAEVVRSSRG